MSFTSIEIPEEISNLKHSSDAVELMEYAHQRIESFMSSHDSVTENFVRCDFHLLDQSLTWIQQNNLLTGNRFCELGSGFGVAAMLASTHGMESIGIEIEDYLVEQSIDLAEELELSVDFYCGSFVPRDVLDVEEIGSDVEHVEIHEDDVYEEVGLGMEDFDLFFAFPWPGEEHFFENVFDAGSAVGSMLLTFRGLDGMHLVRKT